MPVRRPHLLFAAGLATACLLATSAPAARSAGDPPLTVNPASVRAAMHCPATFSRPKTPALLVHGTGSTAVESWSHTLAKTLPADGHDVCTVDLPERALGDIQVAAQYVVVAIEDMAARAGRRVDVVGHSQGGLEPRWALKWFPSTQALVDDYVALSSTEHGSLDAAGACAAGSCAPAVWQQRPGSAFLTALNRGDETPGDQVSYTSVYSLTDEIVPELPPPPTSMLAGASNIAVQDICPARPVNHVGMLTDPVGNALVLDALDHPGPADPRRVPLSTCLLPYAPGLDAADLVYEQAIGLGNAGVSTLVTGPMTNGEPPLAGYTSVAAATAAVSPPQPSAPPNADPAPQRPAQVKAARATLAATGGGANATLLVVMVAIGLAGLAFCREGVAG